MSRVIEDRDRVRGQCTYCGGEVKPPKRYWCGEECVHEWKLRRDPSYLRDETYKRDKGVCARCGLDTKPHHKKLVDLRKSILKLHWGKKPEEAAKLAKVFWDLALKFNYKLPKEKDPVQFLIRYRVRSLWEANHILPVYDGGGACGLENIESLCKGCHLDTTRQQAKHRAAKRKAEKENQDDKPRKTKKAAAKKKQA